MSADLELRLEHRRRRRREKKRRYRQRVRAGEVIFRVKANHWAVADLLVATGHLQAWDASDKGKVLLALEQYLFFQYTYD